ncbi:hypothetical protein SDC9_110233 [bioreactor metagenome]|uniref:Uncharacterized protein n=1 Tax=bioreactor metagenome TaxID=1076179 RepID=A0A645BJH6_9ZZZZ
MIVAEIRQVVTPENQHHRLAAGGEIVGQAAQHGVRVPRALDIDRKQRPGLVGETGRGLHRRKNIVRAVFVGGVGHVVLDGGGVVEQGIAAGHGRFKLLLNQPRHIIVGDPAALVRKIGHVLGKLELLRAEEAEDVLPVVKPGVAWVKKRGGVAVRVEDAVQAVQISVHRTEGGGGCRGKGVGLHPRQHVELRVRGASRKPGDHHMAGDAVGALTRGVEIFKRLVLRRIRKHGLVCQVGERLIHHHNHVHWLPLSGGRGGVIPALRLRPAVSVRLIHGVGGEVVSEAVGKPQLVEHGGDIVGVGHREGVVESVGGVDRKDQTHQHAQRSCAASQPDGPAPARPVREKGFTAQKYAQNHQKNADSDYNSDRGPGEMDVVVSHGAAGFFQQSQIPGKYRLIPNLNFDAIGNGEKRAARAYQSGG